MSCSAISQCPSTPSSIYDTQAWASAAKGDKVLDPMGQVEQAVACGPAYVPSWHSLQPEEAGVPGTGVYEPLKQAKHNEAAGGE